MTESKTLRGFVDGNFEADKIYVIKNVPRPRTHFQGITYGVRNVEPRSTSTCQTIYKRRLKMEESKSTVGEFEESGNDAVNCSTDDVCSEIRRGSCMEAEESGRVKEIQDPPVQFTEIKRHPQKYSSDIKMTEFDEFNAFAVSIGSQLKRLDPAMVKELEFRIMIILNEERTKQTRFNAFKIVK